MPTPYISSHADPQHLRFLCCDPSPILVISCHPHSCRAGSEPICALPMPLALLHGMMRAPQQAAADGCSAHAACLPLLTLSILVTSQLRSLARRGFFSDCVALSVTGTLAEAPCASGIHRATLHALPAVPPQAACQQAAAQSACMHTPPWCSALNCPGPMRSQLYCCGKTAQMRSATLAGSSSMTVL